MLRSEPEVDSASNTTEYQEYLLSGKGGQCVRLTTLPPSCAKCLEILGASTSCSPQSVLACNGIAFSLSQLTLTAVTVPTALYIAFLLS